MRAGLFRVAVPAPASWNVLKTLAQSAVLWGLALWIVPLAIVRLAQGWDASWLRFAPWPRTGWTLLAIASAAGLWSGVTMARCGEGTPLPLDHARRLVIAGPYAYIRNPMAVFGLAQGVGVSLVLGSTAVLLYVAVGGCFWNWVLRPLEERDLTACFGGAYERYRRAVPCWRPRLSRYDDAT